MTVMVSVLLNAQQSDSNSGADLQVKVNTHANDPWYASPVLWIIATAIFILLLVALLRGSSRRKNQEQF